MPKVYSLFSCSTFFSWLPPFASHFPWTLFRSPSFRSTFQPNSKNIFIFSFSVTNMLSSFLVSWLTSSFPSFLSCLEILFRFLMLFLGMTCHRSVIHLKSVFSLFWKKITSRESLRKNSIVARIQMLLRPFVELLPFKVYKLMRHLLMITVADTHWYSFTWIRENSHFKYPYSQMIWTFVPDMFSSLLIILSSHLTENWYQWKQMLIGHYSKDLLTW